MKLRLKRRRFGQLIGVSVVTALLSNITKKTVAQSRRNTPTVTQQTSESGYVNVKLRVNGKEYPIQIEPRVTLLDALRERIGLSGTKKGCDRGQCGACTVLVNGRRINSCLTLAIACDDSDITTVEGLARGDELHPVQAAFIEHDANAIFYATGKRIRDLPITPDKLL